MTYLDFSFKWSSVNVFIDLYLHGFEVSVGGSIFNPISDLFKSKFPINTFKLCWNDLFF